MVRKRKVKIQNTEPSLFEWLNYMKWLYFIILSVDDTSFPKNQLTSQDSVKASLHYAYVRMNVFLGHLECTNFEQMMALARKTAIFSSLFQNIVIIGMAMKVFCNFTISKEIH